MPDEQARTPARRDRAGHGIRDDSIADDGLVQGGLVFFLTNASGNGNAYGRDNANKDK